MSGRHDHSATLPTREPASFRTDDLSSLCIEYDIRYSEEDTATFAMTSEVEQTSLLRLLVPVLRRGTDKTSLRINSGHRQIMSFW